MIYYLKEHCLKIFVKFIYLKKCYVIYLAQAV